MTPNSFHTILVQVPDPKDTPKDAPSSGYRGMNRQRYLSDPSTPGNVALTAYQLDGAVGPEVGTALDRLVITLRSRGDFRWELLTIIAAPDAPSTHTLTTWVGEPPATSSVRFLGWDVGESAPEFWSAIAHRDEFLPPDAQHHWSKRLNSFGLFDSLDDAWAFTSVYLNSDDSELEWGPATPEEQQELYRPRAIWLREVPQGAQQSVTPPFPVGEVLLERFLITDTLTGLFERGRFRGVVLESGAPVVITTSLPHGDPLRLLERSLRLSFPGISPLITLEKTSVGDPVRAHLDILVEAEPPFRSANTWDPLTQERALEIAAVVSCQVAAVHQTGATIFGIRPETIYGNPQEPGKPEIWLVPRTESFWAKAPLPSMGVTQPFRWLYQGPETLSGKEPTVTTDVFAICAILTEWLTGRHPYAAPETLQHVMRLSSGRPDLNGVPSPLIDILTRGLAKIPTERPTANELATLLETFCP